jgi:hypothetical protein
MRSNYKRIMATTSKTHVLKEFLEAKASKKKIISREIQEWESHIKTEERAIQNLHHFQDAENDVASEEAKERYARSQIERRKTKITELKGKIVTLRQRFEMLKSGELDEEIRKDIEIIKLNSLDLRKKEKEKFQHKRSVLHERQRALTEKRESDREGRREYYKKQRIMNSYQRHFDRTTPPANIRKNLEQFPNNKGYIWKGIEFWGKKQSQPGAPRVLFEPGRRYLKIHEWKQGYYRIYQKMGRARKGPPVYEERRRPGIAEAFWKRRNY